MIPKILHQIFIANEKIKTFPYEWKRFVKKAKSLHRDWEYILWDKKRLYHFIEEHYPQYQLYFTEHTPFVVQSDIGRYLILKHMGGWYFDCDYEIIQPLNVWEDNSIILPYERAPQEKEGENEEFIHGQIGNSILASEPNHWFWDYILKDLPDYTFFTQNIEHDDIIHTTGPKKLTNILNSLSDKEKKAINCPHRNHFHVPTLHHMSSEEYNDILSRPGVYGIHHTHSSWRDHELLKNIRRRILYRNPITRPLIKAWEKYLISKRATKK